MEVRVDGFHCQGHILCTMIAPESRPITESKQAAKIAE
jgi:ferredoxin